MIENIFKSAVLHHTRKNFSKAKEIYESLLQKNPNNLAILQNYASLLSQTKEYKKAGDTFRKCLQIKPEDPLLLYNYGKFFHDQKIFEKAIKFYTESFKLNPKNDVPLYNVGNIYLSQGKFEQAIDTFKKVIEINPSNFVAHNNIGIAYKRIGNFSDALKFYKKAINKKNDYVDAHINYSTMLLTTNKLEEGLEEYEWRKKSKSFSDYIDYRSLNLKSKVWNGENLRNKKLFIIAEQGIGDLIQFGRYLYLLKEKYKTEVILKIKGKNFLHFFDQKDFKIVLDDQPIPAHDYHNFMMSLPRIFFKTGELFCRQVNFFRSDNKVKAKWQKKLQNIDRVKVGIHWSTSSLMPEKDLPFKYFDKLSKDINVNLFVLQKNVSLDEEKLISKNKKIFYFPDIDKSEKAFIDSIEIVRNLDLVITSDTAMAHLSATLGKKTWIALPMVADWRWFMDKKNTKWYPNATLYRQEKIGEWERVFEIIKEKFEEEFRDKLKS